MEAKKVKATKTKLQTLNSKELIIKIAKESQERQETIKGKNKRLAQQNDPKNSSRMDKKNKILE